MECTDKPPTDILQYTGNIGVYQVCLFLALSALGLMSIDSTPMIFTGGFMDHWCQIDALQNYSFAQQQYIALPVDEGTDTGFDECYQFPLDFNNYTEEELQGWDRDHMTGDIESGDLVSCSQWVFDQSVYRSTISSKWSLVCDDGWMVEMATTVMMGGKLVGSICCGLISDRFGRLPGIVLFLSVQFLGCLISLYAPWYALYCIGRAFVGAGSTGANLCSFVLITELMGSQYRAALGTMWNIVFSLAYMATPVFAYYLRTEDSLQSVYTWSLLPCCLFLVTLQESPRWLLSKGRQDQADEIIHFIGEVNHNKLPEKLDLSLIKTDLEKGKADSEHRGTLVDLFRYPNLRKETCIIYFNWFTNSLVYYGLALNTGQLAGSIYLNTFLMGAVEIPANLLAIYLMNKIGRKWTIGWSLIFGGATSIICVILILTDTSPEVLTVFSILGKAGVTMAFSGAYVYAVEIFPTPVRNVGIGSSSMCARVSGMAAPFVGGPLADIWAPLPSLIFAVFALVSGGTMFLVPETLNQKLPETLEEAELFGQTGFLTGEEDNDLTSESKKQTTDQVSRL